MATVAEIQELYDLGKIPEAMAAVWAEVYEERKQDDPELGKLMVIRAWCHWRRQEWNDARKWLNGANEAGGADLRVKRLCAYFAAYLDKNDGVLRAIATELPDDISVQNALLIRAREADIGIAQGDVLLLLNRFTGESVEVANLYHNGARFFLAQKQDREDAITAVDLIDIALAKYGDGGNWHHRAAANFWRSQALERLDRTSEALQAIQESMRLWRKAVELDPTNQGFQQNLRNAQEREVALTSIQQNWQ